MFKKKRYVTIEELEVFSKYLLKRDPQGDYNYKNHDGIYISTCRNCAISSAPTGGVPPSHLSYCPIGQWEKIVRDAKKI